MVVSIVLCPQMIWAMCGGSPLMIASVTNPSEVVGRENQWFAGGVGEHAGERVDEQFADRAGCEGSVLVADGALKQQRHRRVHASSQRRNRDVADPLGHQPVGVRSPLMPSLSPPRSRTAVSCGYSSNAGSSRRWSGAPRSAAGRPRRRRCRSGSSPPPSSRVFFANLLARRDPAAEIVHDVVVRRGVVPGEGRVEVV